MQLRCRQSGRLGQRRLEYFHRQVGLVEQMDSKAVVEDMAEDSDMELVEGLDKLAEDLDKLAEG